DFHVTGVQTCALPISGGELAADAEDTQAIVAMLRDLVRRAAEQHVDDVRRAEALAAAIDRREQLARRFRAVARLRRREADVAVRSEERRVGKERVHRG